MDVLLPQKEYGGKLFEVEISFNDLIIDRNEIDISLGYPAGELPPQFNEMVDEALSKLPTKCEIKAGYKILDVEKLSDRADGLNIGKIFFNMQKIVTSQLKKSEQAAFFLCTIGSKMENWSKQLMAERDPTLSYIVDTVASVAVESVADVLHDQIGLQMQKLNLKITNRYSPGYCNWSVMEQHQLFSFFPENFCNIKLTDTALMLPIKSISGVIGIGSDVVRAEYLCDRCGIKDCTYRAFRIDRDKRIKSKIL